jgi:hypothetical protein
MRILPSVLIFLFALAAHSQESPIQPLLQGSRPPGTIRALTASWQVSGTRLI